MQCQESSPIPKDQTKLFLVLPLTEYDPAEKGEAEGKLQGGTIRRSLDRFGDLNDTAAFVTVRKPEPHDFDATDLICSHKANPFRIGQTPDNVQLLPLFFNDVKRDVHGVNGKQALPEFGLADRWYTRLWPDGCCPTRNPVPNGNWIAV